jgi:hypothetical protein
MNYPTRQLVVGNPEAIPRLLKLPPTTFTPNINSIRLAGSGTVVLEVETIPDLPPDFPKCARHMS